MEIVPKRANVFVLAPHIVIWMAVLAANGAPCSPTVGGPW